MLRIWTLIAVTILGAAWLPAQNPYVAQPSSNLSQGFGSVAPAALTQTSSTDPYALVSVRRTLPWLGGIIGLGNGQSSARPLINSSPTGQLANGGLINGGGLFNGGGIFGNGGFFNGTYTNGNFVNGNSPLFGGGSGVLSNGQSLFARSPLLNLGQYFPNFRNRFHQRLWVGVDWLLWDTKGTDTPALITTSPAATAQPTAAVLGEAGTNVLFGNQEINGDTTSGIRVAGGFWFTPQQNFAIEAEYFRLREQDEGFAGNSDSNAILGRPFFDIVAGQETAQLVSFPGLASGSVNVNTETNLRSILINGRASLCPGKSNCNSCGIADRVDWIVGFRHIQLDDDITINENITSLIPTAPGTIALTDRFRTENEFNGLQLGVIHRFNFQRAWLESMLRVALGNNQQTVHISGTNTITESGVTDTLSGGLLAQRTNSGTREQDEFSMIPEIGVQFGYRFTNSLSAKIGYSVIYFPNVVRAGDQIDTDLNPNLIPPEAIPFTGALRPRFSFVESDYWAHGLTLGGEYAF